MGKLDVHFSSGKDDWETPQWLFDELNKEFNFTWDAACTRGNAKCKEGFFHDAGENALDLIWDFRETYWCNPPYSRKLQKEFIAKAALYRKHGVTTVMLLPARTDTKAFHRYIYNQKGVEIRFLEGRLKFEISGVPSKDAAPFPSMVVIFRGEE